MLFVIVRICIDWFMLNGFDLEDYVLFLKFQVIGLEGYMVSNLCVIITHFWFVLYRSAEEFLTDPSQDKWKRHTVLSNDSGYSTTDSLEKIGWSPNVSEVCYSASVCLYTSGTMAMPLCSLFLSFCFIFNFGLSLNVEQNHTLILVKLGSFHFE